MEEKKKQTPKRGPQAPWPWQSLIWYLPLMFLLLWLWQDVWTSLAVQTIPYSQFKDHLARGEVRECVITEDAIEGRIVPKAPASKTTGEAQAARAGKQGERAASEDQPTKTAGRETGAAQHPPGPVRPFVFRTVRVEDPKLVEQLEAAGVKFTGVRPGLMSQVMLAWVLPLGLMMLLWFFVFRRIGTAGQAVMNIGKSKARLVADKDTGVTFDDVAGCDEAKVELAEVVDFLKSPDRYAKLGAKIPKGLLLVGPPGTGKTLLARAIAGEAKVPFFSISGSDFVEMFVGVGAARVRDLFEQAKRHAPCIVFIDEIDAIGRQRGVHVGAVNDEREQTLNQLLVEMDGFEPNTGVILVAATNRPEVLDRALLRPGRFDRQVVVDVPDLEGRRAILEIHARNKPLAPDVDLSQIARATPGFSGADLANIMNEAALLAARRGSKTIAQQDLEEAVEKVVAGPERRSRRLDEEEKRRVAYHEVGHALVAAWSPHADPVHKISIVPRGRGALGYTLQLPEEQQYLLTRAELLDRIKGLLGGRAAEEIVFGDVSTGAQNDLERATALARQMVCTYGMSDAVGLMHCAGARPQFLPEADGSHQYDCSEETARQIDKEVQRILTEAYNGAKQILQTHRDLIERVAERLIQQETIDQATFHELIGRAPPAGRRAASVAMET
ncbi:MAG TPA: ATP-dependent zinc metalloprotease FtsH [Planctomycetaceae bacterium]|nr:ATP-dependent zinc metalloprotease FtsH [Planctomycetaceae bacterium]HIQ23297.1 ATP-dependent zinc metalloprotease FtsH [Planctomycetota bacterium]